MVFVLSVGWEKVKNAMSKKNLADANRQRLMTSSTEESPPVAKRQEMAEDGYLSPGESTDDGARKGPRREGSGMKKMGSQKREKGNGRIQISYCFKFVITPYLKRTTEESCSCISDNFRK